MDLNKQNIPFWIVYILVTNIGQLYGLPPMGIVEMRFKDGLVGLERQEQSWPFFPPRRHEPLTDSEYPVTPQ
ncbi:hypothetical protein J6590_075069, partial [Homalodisca vitripennis]